MGRIVYGGVQESLGIVGSGTIAKGLARTAAEHGDVVLWARSDESARAAGEHLDAHAVEVTTELDALAAQCSFIVEAVIEDPETKTGILEELGRRVHDDAILATTTSSLSIADLAAASGRPDRFAALHVFNPVPKMPLVELCFPPEAAADVRDRTRLLCLHLGKTPVEVPDVPGFVVNRLLFPYLFAAVQLREETGMAAEDVDACMRLGAGHPMGPLALLDLVGLDVSVAIGETIGAEVPPVLREMVQRGELGRKCGRGFYAYES
jgi:3-hydroxybutyryl-CoA dehydrogenase